MGSKREVTVASVQMDVEPGNREATLARVLGWADRAAESKADVVVFPELVLSASYHFDDSLYELTECVPGPTTEVLGEKARAHNMHIIAGIAERAPTGAVYNTAVIVGRKGELSGVYRKTHIFTPTESYFALGTTLSVFDLDFGRIAIPICYDLEFPECARVLCLQGAEMLLSMAAHWRGTGSVGTPENFITTVYASRSLENRVPVALANRVGFDPHLNDSFVGLSRIVDADGLTVEAMEDDGEGIIVATLDLEQERRKRLSYNYFRDRKPLLYQALTTLQ